MAPLLRLGALALCTTLMGHAVASESPAVNCRPVSLAFYELGLLYYRDAQRNANGIDVDLVRELSARSGCRFDTVLEWRVRIWSQLAAGELDASVSGIATPERSCQGVHKHQSTARCEASGQGLCRCWGGQAMGVVNADGAAIYKYLNFNQIDEYVENAKGVTA